MGHLFPSHVDEWCGREHLQPQRQGTHNGRPSTYISLADYDKIKELNSVEMKVI